MRRNSVSSVTEFFHNSRASRVLVMAHDAAMAAIAFFCSVWFAFGMGFRWAGPKNLDFYIWSTVTFATIAVAVFLLNDLHRGVWRYTSFRDVKKLVWSSALTVLLFLPVAFVSSRMEDLPRASIILAFIFLTVLLAAPRVALRALNERSAAFPTKSSTPKLPIVLIGVGARAESYIREMLRHPETPYAVQGLIAPTPYWLDRQVQGIPVVATVSEVASWLDTMQNAGRPVHKLVLADDGLSQSEKDHILSLTSERGISLGRLPASMEIRDANLAKAEIMPLALEDLLHRPQKTLDRNAMRELITGRRVLITGAGGSIGSELVRQIAKLSPEAVALVDNCEFNLYAIDQELEQNYPMISRAAKLVDIRDRRAIASAFSEFGPEIVFHAAAYKHVPMVESNPIEGVRTNVIGTRNVADECVAHRVSAMVVISTDKAVNPTNVMGATKRLAESYAQALDLQSSVTRFVTVRFGNVLGSTGSVVPLFQRQIAAGGPVTVTHPDITRYFMTIPEAVQLVLQASVLGCQSQTYRGSLFVLDMGEPVKIADLARQMIRLAGKRPDIDIPIKFVGLRPGEKLHEELLHTKEELVESPHPSLSVATPRTADLKDITRDIEALDWAAGQRDETRTMGLLCRAVPEFIAITRKPETLPREQRLVLVRS